MPSPLYSGAAVIHVGTVLQQPEFGWDFYETLAENGAVAGQGNGTVIEAVARGEKAYGIIIDYMALNAAADGSPVDFVFPEEGVSAITQPVGILSSTDNEAGRQDFRRLAAGPSGAGAVGGAGLLSDPRRRHPTGRLSGPGEPDHPGGRSR